MSFRMHQTALGLIAVLLVMLFAFSGALHQQYRLLVVAGGIQAGTAGDDVSAHALLDPAPLDLNWPSVSRQIDLLLYNLLPGRVTPVLVTPAGSDSAASRLIEIDAIRPALRIGFLVRLGAGCLFLLLAGLVLRHYQRRHYSDPLGTLVGSINSFSEDPRVTAPVADMVARSPEFIEAARALDTLQRNTLLALRQRERLADVGEAVAKINHDIRNALSSATLVADTLLASKDDRLRRMAPHIIRSLEQSVNLCQSMLDYLAETPPPEPKRFAPADLLAEIGESSGMATSYSGPDAVFMDREMLSRILLNLARNASFAGADKLSVDIWRAGRLGVIDIADDGPGIPQEQWDDLFLAFRSKQRGGTGLGLAIARDLAVAQGGNLKLTRSTADGSEFRMQLPVEIFDGAADTR